MGGAEAATRRVAFVVIVAVLGARLVTLAAVHARRPSAFLYVDSAEYIGPARALLSLGVYAPTPERSNEAEVVRPPGYPLLVAATFSIFGEVPLAVSAAGAFVATATALVLLLGPGRFFGRRAAACGAILLCLDAGSFGRSLDVLSETFFTLLLVLGLWALAAAVAKGPVKTRSAALAGCALGCAILVRPILVYFPAAAAVGLVIAEARSGGRLRRLALVGTAFLLPVALLVGGWIVRNGLATGSYLLTPVAGHQLLHRRAASVVAMAKGTTLSEAQEMLGIREAFLRWRGPTAEAELFAPRRYAEVFPATAGLSTAELDRIWAREARRIFREHPVLTARMLAKGAAMLLLAPPSLVLSVNWGFAIPGRELLRRWTDQELAGFAALLLEERPFIFLVSAACVAQLVAVYLAASVGAVRFRSRVPAPVHAVLLGAFLYLVATSAGTDASDDRFRVPLMPVVCIYAGAALSTWRRTRSGALLAGHR